MAPTSCSRGFPSLFSTLSLNSRTTTTAAAAATTTSKSTVTRLNQIRTQSTARRTTKRLRQSPVSSAPRPHATAATHVSRSSRSTSPNVTSISFDPPSSAPTPFHTPSIFLPESDPRRKLFAVSGRANSGSTSTSSSSSSSSSGASSSGLSDVAQRYAAKYNPYAADVKRRLPPATGAAQVEKKYHLTPEDLKEMRELRAQDPSHWTRARLAERFGCSQMFVAIGAPTVREQRDLWWTKRQEDKDRQGAIKRKARVDRAKRKELWYMDA